MFPRRCRNAFTLLEALLAVSVVSALATIVIMALGPRENFRRAYDAERRSHVNALIKALNNYHWTEGSMPQGSAVPVGAANAKPICDADVTAADCAAEGGVSLDILVSDYLTAIPNDLAEPCPNRTGYAVYQEGGRALALAAHLGRLSGEVPPPAEGCGAFTTGTDGCPHPNDEVYAVVRAGGITYIGGAFTNVGGHPRKRLAALDGSCALTSWNPGANDKVRAIAVAGSTIYVGGEFTEVGSPAQMRNRIAAIDTNGTVLSWNPNANSKVLAIAVYGPTVYAGGEFTTIGGASKNYLAALDASGNATGWSPNPNARVLAVAVAVDGSTIYVGGEFTSVGGDLRNRIAQVQSDGAVTNWNPDADAPVRAILVNAPNIYVGGDFQNIGKGAQKQARNRVAKINPGDNVTSWDPNANNPVYAIAIHGSTPPTILLGGHFTSVGDQPRNRLAQADDNNGTVQSWNPNAQDDVHALIVDGSAVFVGGKFQSIGGDTSLSRFARIAAPAP